MCNRQSFNALDLSVTFPTPVHLDCTPILETEFEMLVLSRKSDEAIVFPGLGITVHILRLNHSVARIGIEAPPEIRVLRKELADGSTEETLDVDAFNPPSISSREHLHELRNQLNGLNLGLQYYRHQMDAGLIDEANKTFLRVIELLGRMEKQVGKRVEESDANEQSNSSDPIQVLLVEDDENQREMLAGILSMRGFTVATASSGQKAIDYLSRNQHPDFVLMDMRMPEGDGPSTILRLREKVAASQMQILATSGSEPREFGFTSGCDRWFPKPLNTDGLIHYMTQTRGTELATSN